MCVCVLVCVHVRLCDYNVANSHYRSLYTCGLSHFLYTSVYVLDTHTHMYTKCTHTCTHTILICTESDKEWASLFVYECLCACVCTCESMCTKECVRTRTRKGACIRVCICIYVRVWPRDCACVREYKVPIHTHIHTHIDKSITSQELGPVSPHTPKKNYRSIHDSTN